MSTATESPTTLNAQDFSGSDDEILDNFAEGPQPGDAPPMDDTHDDGTPMGLGGEEGKQSEPASSTLEADIAKEDTKPGEEIPPEDDEAKAHAAASEPVQDEGEEVDEEIPSADDEEPTTPEFSPVLLQMAGYTDAEAAKADGFGTPETLHAFIRGRGQLLAPEREGPLYGRSSDKTPPPVDSAPPKEAEATEFKPFELSEEQLEELDPTLVDVLKNMNEHYQQEAKNYQQEVQSLRSTVSQRTEQQQEADEVSQFDQAIQNLGEQWQDMFGTGPGEELADNAYRDPVAMANFRNRDDLFEEVSDLRDRNANKGFAPMSLQQEIQYALMQRHPDKFQQSVSGKPERKSRSISRPTQRKTPPKTQNDKTLAAVNRLLAKKGRPKLSVSEHDDFDGEI